MDNNVFFKEVFDVLDVNCDTSVAENVNRIHCEGIETQTDLLLDLYSPVFNVKKGEKINVLLVKEIQSGKRKLENDDSDMEVYDANGQSSTVDPLDTSSILNEYSKFKYIMHGKIYKIENKMISTNEPIIAVYASFGGLLFRLQTSLENHSDWHIDRNLYLLIRREKKKSSE
ncbi:DNA-directed RNA polymerases I, II, and III subunit RPABC3 [Tetranychus urticae]|uniref:DNA-directed RNA polymerases I, II, and III subunit RPABC3 n=1 Tax=Tetranychus urticae TaxID=32264 RepID=T1KD24_TETUR|nr:DNA-directed RNA polymerases I, II, and III subunit RPABC3 [Tetranychus urticae]